MDYFDHNLAALRTFQPDVAARVEAAFVPSGVRVAKGRDGARTFLVDDPSRIPPQSSPQEEGMESRQTSGPSWFGGSSMPTISAVECFADFRSDGSNVALPGILTGLEPIVVLERLPPHTVLFIIEPDAVNLKLAMRLHDYTAWIDAGRLVFVLSDGGAVARSLCQFFERKKGYLPPRQLLTVPQRSLEEITVLQKALEEAGRVVTEQQWRAVASERGELPG